MHSDQFVKFLGTAGARYVVARQLRSSAGTFIKVKGHNIMLDPGPGTLVRCAKSRPKIDVTKLDAIILTHSHVDHSNDVNVLIDAMTEGGLTRRGVLFAPLQCLEGRNAVVFAYLREFLTEITILKPNRRYSLGDVSFSTSVRHQHSVETYGVKLELDGLVLSFMVDTRYFPGLTDSYAESTFLVMNVVRQRPHESGEVLHLCVDDVRRILSRIGPRRAILTHFGMTMLRARPWQIAEKLTEDLGIQVVAASDGMTVALDEV